MAVVVHIVLRGVAREQYDAIRAEVGWPERTPAGCLSHLMWWGGNDCHNVDAWEMEAKLTMFREKGYV